MKNGKIEELEDGSKETRMGGWAWMAGLGMEEALELGVEVGWGWEWRQVSSKVGMWGSMIIWVAHMV